MPIEWTEDQQCLMILDYWWYSEGAKHCNQNPCVPHMPIGCVRWNMAKYGEIFSEHYRGWGNAVKWYSTNQTIDSDYSEKKYPSWVNFGSNEVLFAENFEYVFVYQQPTDRSLTCYCLSANRRSTSQRSCAQILSADCWPFVSRLLAGSRPTGYSGSCSSLTPAFHTMNFFWPGVQKFLDTSTHIFNLILWMPYFPQYRNLVILKFKRHCSVYWNCGKVKKQ